LFLALQSGLCFAQKINFEINPTDVIDGNDQKHLSYEIKPTKSVEDIVTIKNNSDQTIKLKVYAVDSLQSTDGGVAFKLEDVKQEAIGSWLKLTRETVEIAPLKSVIIPYTIAIPEKVTPGTYEGALVAEIIPNKEAEPQKNAIKITTRLTEALFISVPGRKIADYSLDQFSVRQDNGKTQFNIKFLNKGNVFLKTKVNLRIEGMLLPRPYEISLNHPTVLQGEAYKKTFYLNNPPLFGNYTATISLIVSEYNVATGETKELQTLTKTVNFYIIPYPLFGALLILIVLIIFAKKWHRKHVLEALQDTFTHAVTKGETITSIANVYKLNWRKIAKLNKLKQPYVLRAGRKLILPFPKAKKTPPSKNPLSDT
jgi:LysM repeat protein